MTDPTQHLGAPFQTAREALDFFLKVAGCGNTQRDQLIDAYARELAEQQRAEADRRYAGGKRGYVDGIDAREYSGWINAADFADPEEQR